MTRRARETARNTVSGVSTGRKDSRSGKDEEAVAARRASSKREGA